MNGIKFSYQAKVVTVCVFLVLAILFIHATWDLVRPLIWAAILTYVLNPLVSAFTARTGRRRIWGATILFVILVASLAGGLFYAIPRLSREMMHLRHNFPGLVSSVYTSLLGHEAIEVFGFHISSQAISNATSEVIYSIAAYLSSKGVPAFFGVLGALTKLLVFLFGTFYFLADADKIGRFLSGLIPEPARGEVVGLCREIDGLLGRYVRGLLVLVLIMSSATMIALSLLHVHYALMLAIMTGVLELFPIVGPIVAGFIACTVGFFQPNPFGWSNFTFAAVIAIVYIVLRHAEDYLVIPNVMGRIVQFHPLVVLLALLSGGMIAGILGMVLAVPAIAILKVVAIYFYHKLLDLPVSAETYPAVKGQKPMRVVMEGEGVNTPSDAG
ncbi:MAG: AI-2E family transporter [Chloroflexi bacterium]|nr:AI-2E family transporter [Chloroflexota bacterium]